MTLNIIQKMCQFTSLLTEHFDAVVTGRYDSVFKQIIRLVYQSYTLEVKPVSCWNMINLHCVKNATHLSPYCCKPFRGDSNAVKGVKIAFFCVLLLTSTLEIRYLLQLLRWIKECRPLRNISSPTWLSRTLLLHFWLFRDTLLKY